MSNFFIIFCYTFFAYGMSVIFTQGYGPFNIFFKLRLISDAISDNFGMLFRCMLCFPTNVGMVFSLFNWFLVPIAITPFNLILGGTGLWWLATILDACYTGGICHLIWNIDDFIDKSTPIYEENE